MMGVGWKRPRFTKPPLDEPFTINYGSPQARGLVAWWPPLASRGTGTLRDMVGRGSNMAFVGSYAYVPSPMNGYNIHYTGGRAVASSVRMPGDEYTMSAWINADNIDGTRTIMAMGDHSVADQVLRILNLGELQAVSYIPTGADVPVTAQIISAAIWYHVTLTRTTTKLAIYLNGTSNMVSATSAAAANYGTVPQFDLAGRGNLDLLTGALADTRICSIALDPSTVWQMYDSATRWDLYAPLLRFWAIGEIAAAGGGGARRMLMGVGR